MQRAFRVLSRSAATVAYGAGALAFFGSSGTVRAAPPNPTAASESTKDASAVACIIDGRKITVGELDAEIKRKPAYAYLISPDSPERKPVDEVRRMALEAMIDRQLLLAAAKSSGKVDETEVRKSVDAVVATYENKEDLEILLKAIGTTSAQWLTEVADGFRIKQFVNKVLITDITVSDDEIKQHFEANSARYAQPEMVRARHILVKVGEKAAPKDDAAAKAKIDALYAQCTAPKADFAKIATEKSDDVAAKARGGDLGLIPRGAMPEFDAVVFTLSPGQISKPFKTKFGYHIVKVDERKSAQKPSLETARANIREELTIKKKAAVLEQRMKELRAGSKIEILIGGKPAK